MQLGRTIIGAIIGAAIGIAVLVAVYLAFRFRHSLVGDTGRHSDRPGCAHDGRHSRPRQLSARRDHRRTCSGAYLASASPISATYVARQLAKPMLPNRAAPETEPADTEADVPSRRETADEDEAAEPAETEAAPAAMRAAPPAATDRALCPRLHKTACPAILDDGLHRGCALPALIAYELGRGTGGSSLWSSRNDKQPPSRRAAASTDA